jgi:SAM-dependent methyltransferase
MKNPISNILDNSVDPNQLWSGQFKIPWGDSEFSERMLREHLSQNHDLASRREEFIQQQIRWIDEKISLESPKRILDLGCGPGLYAKQFADQGWTYRGIDISPASIEHAKSAFGEYGEYEQGDVRSAPYGTGLDVVCFIYGEFNVFSETDERLILDKAFEALNPGGWLLLELQNYDSVKAIGETPPSWYRSGEGLTGLFSEDPHLVLVENRWLEEQETSLQEFFVLGADSSEVAVYHNTTRAITDEGIVQLLESAGFAELIIPSDWPVPEGNLRLLVARKPL